MRSYYTRLNKGNYRVTVYGLSKNKGVYSMQYETVDNANKDADGNVLNEEDLLPVDNTVADIHDEYNKVLDIDNSRLTIPCYMFIAINKIKLNISSPLGNKASLNMFTDKYLFHSFKLVDNGSQLDSGLYEFEFSWEGIDDDSARMTNVATFDEDSNSISAEEADILLHENNLYVKIFDEDLSEYKLIPIIVNIDTGIDAYGNILPLQLHFQLNGIENSGLAQITIDAYPIRYNLNAEYLISGDETPIPSNNDNEENPVTPDTSDDSEDNP